MLEPVFSHIRDNMDNLNLTVVKFYAVQVLEKWRRKRVSMHLPVFYFIVIVKHLEIFLVNVIVDYSHGLHSNTNTIL